ncbi:MULTISPECIES: VOC family protein [Hungatella]|nr:MULTISPECIES: VOC family protein [Hungatella]MCQ4832098.1 VOC family protein [Hungatella sp. SL.1.14]CUP53352.1 glyoxalase/bleomycin resistance protein/dioxygenase [Hungatella hathewayi]
MITGLDHITVNMADREASFQFYEEVLGLEKLYDVDMGDHRLTYFNLNGCTRLELIEYYNDSPAHPEPSDDKGIYRHMALTTDEIGRLFDRCTAYGVKVLMEPVWVETLNWTGMLVRDPNGVEIEIVQRESSAATDI